MISPPFSIPKVIKNTSGKGVETIPVFHRLFSSFFMIFCLLFGSFLVHFGSVLLPFRFILLFFCLLLVFLRSLSLLSQHPIAQGTRKRSEGTLDFRAFLLPRPGAGILP